MRTRELRTQPSPARYGGQVDDGGLMTGKIKHVEQQMGENGMGSRAVSRGCRADGVQSSGRAAAAAEAGRN